MPTIYDEIMTFQKLFYLLFFVLLISCTGGNEDDVTATQNTVSNRILKFYGPDPALTTPIAQNQSFTIANGKVTNYDFGAWAGKGEIFYSGNKITKIITSNYLTPVYSNVEFFFEYDNNVLKKIKGVYSGGTVERIDVLRIFYENSKISRLVNSQYQDEYDITTNNYNALSRQYAFAYSGENIAEIIQNIGYYSEAQGFSAGINAPTRFIYEDYTDQKNPFSTFPVELRVFLSSVISTNFQIQCKNFPKKKTFKNPNYYDSVEQAEFKSDSEGWIISEHEPNNPLARAVFLYEIY
ncbi:hypothetical protein ACM40_15620 [Chryseobacterium sp. BLS98]|nr:hypothetical protein ACM40_15620 [Chryseobacterium sp. BLS98]